MHRFDDITGAESPAEQGLAQGGEFRPRQRQFQRAQFAVELNFKRCALVRLLEGALDGRLDEAIIEQAGFQFAADAMRAVVTVAGERGSHLFSGFAVVQETLGAQARHRFARRLRAGKLFLQRPPHLGHGVRPAGEQGEGGRGRFLLSASQTGPPGSPFPFPRGRRRWSSGCLGCAA